MSIFNLVVMELTLCLRGFNNLFSGIDECNVPALTSIQKTARQMIIFLIHGFDFLLSSMLFCLELKLLVISYTHQGLSLPILSSDI